jgi:hypothetical protein
MRKDVALIHEKPKRDYGVSLPDFPGSATTRTTVDDARPWRKRLSLFNIDGPMAEGAAAPIPSISRRS